MINKPQIWGLHMPSAIGLKAVDEGFMAIGWPEVGDLGRLPQTRQAFKDEFAKVYPSTKRGSVPASAAALFKFVCEVQEGEAIVYPSKVDRLIHLGFVVGRYTFSPTEDPDFPNRRGVSWLGSFPRAAFSQPALNVIGSAVCLFRVDNHADEFRARLPLSRPTI